MSGASSRRGGPERLATLLPWVASGAGVRVLALIWVSVHVAAALDGAPAPTKNPVALPIMLATGRAPWPRLGLFVLAAVLLLLIATGIGVYLLIKRIRGLRVRGDKAGRMMGRGDEITAITAQAQRATAERLGVVGSFGTPIGASVQSGQVLYQGVEDVSVDIWGPRRCKSSCRVIPAIVEAPGAVFSTSNKRDIVDATRGIREQLGPVWIFDPQNLVGRKPTWWWNPLSYIRSGLDAEELAGVLFAVAQGPESKTDAFFTPAGKALLANFIPGSSVGQVADDAALHLVDQADQGRRGGNNGQPRLLASSCGGPR